MGVIKADTRSLDYSSVRPQIPCGNGTGLPQIGFKMILGAIRVAM